LSRLAGGILAWPRGSDDEPTVAWGSFPHRCSSTVFDSGDAGCPMRCLNADSCYQVPFGVGCGLASSSSSPAKFRRRWRLDAASDAMVEQLDPRGFLCYFLLLQGLVCSFSRTGGRDVSRLCVRVSSLYFLFSLNILSSLKKKVWGYPLYHVTRCPCPGSVTCATYTVSPPALHHASFSHRHLPIIRTSGRRAAA
jgi:hypothetical protein